MTIKTTWNLSHLDVARFDVPKKKSARKSAHVTLNYSEAALVKNRRFFFSRTYCFEQSESFWGWISI